MKTGIELIAEERREQIEKHGFTPYEDFQKYWDNGQLKQAAIFCLTLNNDYYPKGWGEWFKDKVIAKKNRMTPEEFSGEMTKIAGAFCAAEIDRLLAIKKEDTK